MAKNEDKFLLNETISSIGILERLNRGIYYEFFPAREDDKIRIVVEEAGITNRVIIRGRIQNATGYDVLGTINGSSSLLVSTKTYDEIQIEVTLFDAPSGRFKLLASGFNIAGGDIEVSTPAGLPSSGSDALSFTSNDATVTITGDGAGGVDFSVSVLAGANYKSEVQKTLSAGDISAKQITLASTPTTPNITQLFVIGGGICEYGTQFIVVGSTLTWSGLGLDGELEIGEKLVVMHD